MSDNLKKRVLWTEEAMSKAESGVKSGKFSVQGTSNNICVPRRTLRRFFLEKDGPLKMLKLVLNTWYKKKLCQRIIRFSSMCHHLTPNILKLIVFRLYQENNIQTVLKRLLDVSDSTVFFLKRNPDVVWQKARNLNPARA